MKKIVYFITTTSFVLTSLFGPLSIASARQNYTNNSNQINSADYYSLKFNSEPQSIWQKSNDIKISSSSTIPLAIYLVPATSSLAVYNKSFDARPGVGNIANYKEDIKYDHFRAANIYASSTEQGYLVGMKSLKNSSGERINNSASTTITISSSDLASIPTGSYSVRIVGGVTCLNEPQSRYTSGSNSVYTANCTKEIPFYLYDDLSFRENKAKLVPIPVSNMGNFSHNDDRSPTIVKNTIISTSSKNLIQITPAPDAFIVITAPIHNEEWNPDASHQVSWVANFKRGGNNTGLSKYAGVEIVRPYGIGLPYDVGGNQYGLTERIGVTAATTLISQAFPVVGQVIGIVIFFLNIFGVFDEAPMALIADVSVIEYATSTNTYGKTILLSRPYIEEGKTNVSVNSLLPGSYIMRVKVNAWDRLIVSGTSTPFIVLPSNAKISDIYISGKKININKHQNRNNTNLDNENSSGQILKSGREYSVSWKVKTSSYVKTSLNKLIVNNDPRSEISRNFKELLINIDKKYISENSKKNNSSGNSIELSNQLDRILSRTIASSTNTQFVSSISSSTLSLGGGTTFLNWNMPTTTPTDIYVISVQSANGGSVFYGKPFVIAGTTTIINSPITPTPLIATSTSSMATSTPSIVANPPVVVTNTVSTTTTLISTTTNFISTTTNLVSIRINAGGSASGDYLADKYFTGGKTYSITNKIDTSAVSNPAPQSVYKTERYGNSFSYKIPNLTPNKTYTVRLDFTENYRNKADSRNCICNYNWRIRHDRWC